LIDRHCGQLFAGDVGVDGRTVLRDLKVLPADCDFPLPDTEETADADDHGRDRAVARDHHGGDLTDALFRGVADRAADQARRVGF
jgi:hypothetical protein